MAPFSTRSVFRSVGWFLLPLVFSADARQAPPAEAPLPPVKPEERDSFEAFFGDSLRPAAAKRAGVQVEDLDLGGFRLLIPSKPNPQGYFTYYVLADPAGGALGGGEAMRDMVREAFPGEEGLERVRRWMESMVLDAPFAPAGENFIEADLRKPRVSDPGRGHMQHLVS